MAPGDVDGKNKMLEACGIYAQGQASKALGEEKGEPGMCMCLITPRSWGNWIFTLSVYVTFDPGSFQQNNEKHTKDIDR